MKNIALLGAALGAVLQSTQAVAQPGWGRGDGGWGPRGNYHSLYNTKTVETFQGSVLSIDTFSVVATGRPGVHLHVKRNKDTMTVHLGPLWYLENQELALSVQDTLTVKGSRVTFNGEPAVIAAEVKKGDASLILRDAKGYPVWSGWKRRRAP